MDSVLVVACVSTMFQGVDEVYDQALSDFIIPYHQLVDVMCRVAVNMQNLSESLISLSKLVNMLLYSVCYGIHKNQCIPILLKVLKKYFACTRLTSQI